MYRIDRASKCSVDRMVVSSHLMIRSGRWESFHLLFVKCERDGSKNGEVFRRERLERKHEWGRCRMLENYGDKANSGSIKEDEVLQFESKHRNAVDIETRWRKHGKQEREAGAGREGDTALPLHLPSLFRDRVNLSSHGKVWEAGAAPRVVPDLLR